MQRYTSPVIDGVASWIVGPLVTTSVPPNSGARFLGLAIVSICQVAPVAHCGATVSWRTNVHPSRALDLAGSVHFRFVAWYCTTCNAQRQRQNTQNPHTRVPNFAGIVAVLGYANKTRLCRIAQGASPLREQDLTIYRAANERQTLPLLDRRKRLETHEIAVHR
ncbi:hypothetical protein CHELA1G11_12431 [Hyphomicrobiales bacterium]|nr:hypothetical protein CHELA1G2_11875 [Hyphomicrobiales bacterium]CAH1664787.1 hypothetical protein CHELA1G11_12431 [Hyphomicrobiales bacterium]